MGRRSSSNETATALQDRAYPIEEALRAKQLRVVEAQRLRAAGCSFRLIGERLGVSTMTAYQWCQPGYSPKQIRGLSFKDRLVPRLVCPDLGPCLEWQGARHPWGYGEFREHGKLVRAHVRAFELAHGPVPVGKLVCHTCDNPPCCEPSHLYAGTPRDNSLDSVSRGRNYRPPAGEASHLAKFSDVIIVQARQLRNEGLLLREIAEKLGIEASYVSRICRGEVRP